MRHTANVEQTKKPTIEKPDVFNYHDYRRFLKDWFAFAKETFGISLRQTATDSGLSVSYLSMVLAGNRNLSGRALEKFLPILELSFPRITYFKLLQTIGDSESHAERIEALDKLQKQSGYKKMNPKELEVYRYLSHWYYVAIREMVELPQFRLDANWIQDRLNYPVPLSEINEALKFLKEFNFIEELPGNKARLAEKRVDCFEGIYKIALSNFYKEMFQLASQSIEKTPRAKRNLSFETMAISSENFDELKQILDDARKKVEALGARVKSPDSIYHVSFAAFPIASLEDENSKESL